MTSRMQIWTLAKRLHRQLPSCSMLPNTICDVIVISVRKWWRRTSFTTSLHLCRPRERYLSLFTAIKLPLKSFIIIKFMYHCSTTLPKCASRCVGIKICNLQFEIQKQPIILLRRKETAGSRMPHYTVISEKLMNDGGSGDASVVSRHYLLKTSSILFMFLLFASRSILVL